VSDSNGTTVVDDHHDTSTPSTRRKTVADTTTSLRGTTTAGLLIDPVVIAQARAELARRYGLLQPDASVALGILLAEGLTRCEEAWQERHEHAVTVAGYERAAKTKPTAVQFPQGLVDAVNRLAEAQYPGVPKIGGRVASAALLHGVALSSKLEPIRDPGLDALAARVG
jgi:hypothetical protein